VVALGVKGITVHPRPDGRHIRSSDVIALADLCADFADVEFNVEGYPSDAFLDLIARVRPDQVTLVPDHPDQLTSDHGWRVREDRELLSDAIGQLKLSGGRVSLFMDSDREQIGFLEGLGADRIDLYTAVYVAAHGTAEGPSILACYQSAARYPQACGLGATAE
jgi:pyridoxine 5-phosphate synthase